MLEVLQAKKVTDVYFCDLASGTCVLASVLDAIDIMGFKVHAVPDCMGWRRFNTYEDAIQKMEKLPVDLVDGYQV